MSLIDFALFSDDQLEEHSDQFNQSVSDLTPDQFDPLFKELEKFPCEIIQDFMIHLYVQVSLSGRASLIRRIDKSPFRNAYPTPMKYSMAFAYLSPDNFQQFCDLFALVEMDELEEAAHHTICDYEIDNELPHLVDILNIIKSKSILSWAKMIYDLLYWDLLNNFSRINQESQSDGSSWSRTFPVRRLIEVLGRPMVVEGLKTYRDQLNQSTEEYLTNFSSRSGFTDGNESEEARRILTELIKE